MREILYATERNFLERYLKERASASLDDFKALSDLYGNTINPIPVGSDEAVREIYSMDGNTAHIKINGVLSPKGPDLWDRFFGYDGVAYGTIQAAMDKARTDPLVQRVILDVNSPGGTLAGTDETWQAHKALAAEKPTEVHAGTRLTSAAYYISVPANKILAVSPSSEIGSIGVLVATYDWSKWEESVGIREVVITSSNAPDKHPDVSTERGKNTIKAELDAMERVFYSRISESRGVTTKHIAKHFGRGGILVAQDPSAEHEDAIRAGMIDGLTTDTAQTAAGETENAPQINSFDGFARYAAKKAGLKTRYGDETPLTGAEVEELLSKEFPLLRDTNTPAPAGTTQEGQTMDLSEFLTANPAAAAEIDKLKSEAMAAGEQKAKADYSARVDKVLPIIQSAVYPGNIKTVACNVLAGKEDMVALTTTVTLFDSNGEAAKSKAAQGHTQELGAVGAEAPNLVSAGEKELDAAVTAELAKRRAK
jgi:ClpP class serine protease